MNHRTPTWLWAVPVLSCGLLAVVPPFAIALKQQSPRAWQWCIAFAAATVLAFTLIGSQPDEADNVWTGLGAAIFLMAWIGSPIYSVIAGRSVPWGHQPQAGHAPPYARPHPGPHPGFHPGSYGPPPDPNTDAVARVEGARARRAEAAALVRRDPALARELRIGRPDLPRQYDDGGLVDVNSAPPGALAHWLGLTGAQADLVADARQRLGRFEDADDLVNLAGLDHGAYERCRDRIVLL